MSSRKEVNENVLEPGRLREMVILKEQLKASEKSVHQSRRNESDD